MVSVCMATFNGSKHIVRQVNSILTQLSETDELIISDDNSTDSTCELLDAFMDKRVKIIKNDIRKGPLANFEIALTHATGNFIFLADQDDVWRSDKVQVMSKSLKRYDLALSDCEIVDESLSTLQASFFDYRNSRPGFWKNVYKNSYIGCCMAFRREVLEYALPFPHSIHMHDWWIGLLVEIRGNVCFIDKPLIKYVRHGNNASPTGEISSNTLLEQMQNRLFLLSNIAIRLLRRLKSEHY